MDAPDDAVDLMELSVVATLRRRSIPIVGELQVVRSTSTLASATASATSASSPPPAATALVTCGAVPRVVPGESAVVAGAWADPAPLALCAHGEGIHLPTVLEQVVSIGVDVAPCIFLALISRGRLDLLGEMLGD